MTRLKSSLKWGRGKKYTAEQIVSLLRQIDVGTANGKMTPQACKEVGITEQTYYRWRKEYGGLQVDQACRLMELEKENAKLKRLVAELSLDKLVLKDIASGNLNGFQFVSGCESFLQHWVRLLTEEGTSIVLDTDSYEHKKAQ